MATPIVLTLPGWQGSGPGHWQTLWEQRYGDRRVEQHDWMRPLRGDWIARLDEVLLAQPAGTRVLLAAHSLGCIQVAAWAAHSRLTARVQGALLVAPGDAERPDLAAQLPSWSPIVRQRLPFASTLLGSRNDPYCGADKARALAADWGADYRDMGERGHLNAESGLGDWPEGRALLLDLNQESN
ncbi:alpha/beta hydrolase [Pseudorhodoferax sp. Leaf267]|uniref:RBBP9/YdeN family alpha/beta hydrolase n=1 Tax=Pseudorhodoferax sp. Leaf267 TaxID=1736316 RepID=UPI0006FAD868|nr:alpha/beta fold hydrolase [Pseudorhodoferax sp. Leaf267]KQP11984.1 alpha/beta hydrolase [Pseudorhodoferax sp. Leaf267]